MSSFRFQGAPILTEVIEFGHNAFPVYTTLRDALISIFTALCIGGIIFWFQKWIGLGAFFVLTFVFIAATHRLRKSHGNAWPWETYMRIIGGGDSKGYVGGRGPRRFSSVWLNGQPKFLIGDHRGLTLFVHSGHVQSPFGRQQPPTVERLKIVRGIPAFPEPVE